MGEVFIFDFHVNVANDMWNLGLKGLLLINYNYRLKFKGVHMFDDPIFFPVAIFGVQTSRY